MKQVYMIGGPNGSGKTTTVNSLLSEEGVPFHEFVNADIIAQGLSPFNPDSVVIAAARIMIKRLEQLVEEEKSFIFETTCAGKNYIRTLEECLNKGYETNLIFLWLPRVEIAIDRVKGRVEQGGHSIPEETIRRRYQSGIKNLITFYIDLCDNVVIYDNTDPHADKMRERIAEKKKGGKLTIYNQEKWQTMQRYV
jgi:predicted ABC-type ATPase